MDAGDGERDGGRPAGEARRQPAATSSSAPCTFFSVDGLDDETGRLPENNTAGGCSSDCGLNIDSFTPEIVVSDGSVSVNTPPQWNKISTMSFASLTAEHLNDAVRQQLEQEAFTNVEALPLLFNRLRRARPGSPLRIPEVKSAEEVFGGRFPVVDFPYRDCDSVGSALQFSLSSAKQVLKYWQAMWWLTKPYKVTLLQLAPGIYDLAQLLVLQLVVDTAADRSGGEAVLIASSCLLVLYVAKQYAYFVYERDVPGASMRFMFRSMVMRGLMMIQRDTECDFAPGPVGSVLSEGVRKAVAIWTAVFACIAHCFAFVLVLGFEAFTWTTSVTAMVATVVWGLSFGVILLLCGLWFGGRSANRTKLHNLERNWRMRYLAVGSHMLARHREATASEDPATAADAAADTAAATAAADAVFGQGGGEQEELPRAHTKPQEAQAQDGAAVRENHAHGFDDPAVRRVVQSHFSGAALAYRKRAFQQYMYGQATMLTLQFIAMLNYFGILFLIGVYMFVQSSNTTASAGQFAALLSASQTIGTSVTAVFQSIANISENFPYLSQLSEILHYGDPDKSPRINRARRDAPPPAKSSPCAKVRSGLSAVKASEDPPAVDPV